MSLSLFVMHHSHRVSSNYSKQLFLFFFFFFRSRKYSAKIFSREQGTLTQKQPGTGNIGLKTAGNREHRTPPFRVSLIDTLTEILTCNSLKTWSLPRYEIFLSYNKCACMYESLHGYVYRNIFQFFIFVRSNCLSGRIL